MFMTGCKLHYISCIIDTILHVLTNIKKVNAKRSCKENVIVTVDIFYFFFIKRILLITLELKVGVIKIITKPS